MIMSLTPDTLALSGGGVAAIVVGGGLLLLTIVGIVMYNRLVHLRQSCKESWADIDAELQRRHDLIPNIVETVKGYASHERSVLETVTTLRNQAVSAKRQGAADRFDIEQQLGAATSGLMVQLEAYPDLKANANFLQLQQELSETETRIARARRFYNDNVRDFHNGVQMFPSSIVASAGGFKQSEHTYFEAGGSSREPVQVGFDKA
jgi:LemA protein